MRTKKKSEEGGFEKCRERERGGAGLQIMDFLQHFPFLCEASLQVTFLITEGDLNNISRNSLGDFDMSNLKVLNENYYT